MNWVEKFFEVLGRHSPTPKNLRSERVVARVTGSPGNRKVTFYGVDQPIPKKIADEIVAEVFPLILIERRNGELSEEVLTSDYIVGQVEGFAEHCILASQGY